MHFSRFQIEPFFLVIPAICSWLGVLKEYSNEIVLICIGIRAFTYITIVINQMATYLDISCFTIDTTKRNNENK